MMHHIYTLCCSLSIEGCLVRAESLSASTVHSTSDQSEYSYLIEEVFATDGHYEDIIAIDSDQ